MPSKVDADETDTSVGLNENYQQLGETNAKDDANDADTRINYNFARTRNNQRA